MLDCHGNYSIWKPIYSDSHDHPLKHYINVSPERISTGWSALLPVLGLEDGEEDEETDHNNHTTKAYAGGGGGEEEEMTTTTMTG